MNVQLVLNHPPSGKFTNLDLVDGSVVLRVPRPTSITHITVKLEGESSTKLDDPDWGSQRGLEKEESHRLLYKVEKVFPPPNVPMRGGSGYLLNPGVYVYPFSFKIPFNNACLSNPAPATGAFVLAPRHVKTTLPPSMNVGINATIRYFVKVTVNIPSLFKENPRAFSFFAFDPIEPPRKPGSGEAYARRTHQFNENPQSPRRSSTNFGTLFKSKTSSEPSSPTSNLPPVRFSVDFRLPNPAILTCGAPLSLRILLRQLTGRTKGVFLQSLQIDLIGFTRIRAQDVEKVDTQHWVLVSKNNMYREIGLASDPAETETEIAPDIFEGLKVPDSACPQFVACNITRWYELHASVGLSYGTRIPGQDQFIVLPLKHNISLYSGIAPPAALLERLQNGRPGSINHVDSGLSTASSVSLLSSSASASASTLVPTPATRPPPARPGQSGVAVNPAPPYEEPPPSYEDAMAENLRPADGARPGYRPPDPMTSGISASGIWRDEKLGSGS